ncbi:VRR-NUC domain-containing protein [Jiulongibacter sediminis]|uniref:VRR-NUC domain-containing protein n=1 Tax=Jiulongibacter sediminis TaxID=1605367 RepID=UPI0026F33E6A|nr:VRR-NUC domain-containing protein [Jiulongibacter sediminis]
MAENENVVLPPKYYLDYFNYLLDFVKDKYKHILNEGEWRFLRKYYALSEDAQCLFIRFTNRRGAFFKTEGLYYEELAAIPELLDELLEREFAEPLSEIHTERVPELLHLCTKADLLKIAPESVKKSWAKQEIAELLREQLDPEEIIEGIDQLFPLIKVNFEYETAFLRFLFFGNRYMDMTEFVVRDLGFVQYFQHDDDKLVARFDTRKDAEDKWMLTDQADLFESLKKTAEPEEIYDWFDTFHDSLRELSEVAKPSLERLKLKVGRHLEREQRLELAVEVYKTCELPQAKERRVRCLTKLKNFEEALELCEDMIVNNTNADEHFFAKDFADRMLRNKNRRKKLTTEKLHEAEKITIPKVYRGQVELGTIEHYLAEGKFAMFSENHLWRGIFGLIFWDIIFDPALVAFHHPFQRRPSDLHLPDFYEKRKEIIHGHLDGFEDTDDLLLLMRNNFVKHEGIANPFVIWMEGIWEGILLATKFIGLEKLKPILIHISKDIAENSRGFPDLFVWDQDGYEFIEVKSPTDNLSNRQLFWLGYFEENEINARVLRVFFEE